MANIVVMGEGVNNSDLEKTNARLQALGNWKKQRILYVIPTGDKIMPRVYLAHRSLIFPPNQAMQPLLIENAEVGAAYDEVLGLILQNPAWREWEYFFTIEHDNVPQPTHVLKLLEAMEAHPEYAAISGLYFTKGELGQPQIWGDVRDPVVNYRPQMPVPEQIMECYGIGMGFALFRMEMFRRLEEKKVPRPWFKTVGNNSNDNGIGTQDLFFWGNIARPNGFRCAVDCSVKVGHMDETGRIW